MKLHGVKLRYMGACNNCTMRGDFHMTRFKRVLVASLGALALVLGTAGAATADLGPQDSSIQCC